MSELVKCHASDTSKNLALQMDSYSETLHTGLRWLPSPDAAFCYWADRCCSGTNVWRKHSSLFLLLFLFLMSGPDRVKCVGIQNTFLQYLGCFSAGWFIFA